MLKVENLRVTADKKDIIKDISFEIKPHSLTVIIGKNGSGKSTLLSAVTGTAKYLGRVSFCSKDFALMTLRQRAQQIAFLPQSLPKVPVTVKELVALGRTPYLDVGKRLTQQDVSRVNEAISLMGIESLAEKRVDVLSGGERQKAYIAMVLAQDTRIIALDEPAAYLDAEYQKELYSLIAFLKQKSKKTLLVVMHDITTAMETADSIIALKQGECVFYGSTEECMKKEIPEKIFGVKKYEYISEGEKRILYR